MGDGCYLEATKRNLQAHAGRDLHPKTRGNAMGRSTALTQRIWAECYRVLRPGGKLILNISDHIRGGEIMPVSEWHKVPESLGLSVTYRMPVPRHGNDTERMGICG